MTDMSKLFRIRPSSSGKINASMFAYRCVYGKSPIYPIFPKYMSNVKHYRHLFVDSELDDKWLDSLNNINNIEIKSVCQGHDPDHPTHIIFKPANQNSDDVELIAKRLSTGQTKCIADIGNGGMYRVCVAVKNWYRSDANNDTWKDWWSSISNKINSIINSK